MTHMITAIYEHGVLRPLEPLALPEQTEVHLTIEAAVPPAPEVTDPRQRFRAAMIAAGLMVEQPATTSLPPPLSDDERAALAHRLAVPGATPLSEIIIEEREGR